MAQIAYNNAVPLQAQQQAAQQTELRRRQQASKRSQAVKNSSGKENKNAKELKKNLKKLHKKLAEKEPKLNKTIKKMKFHRLLWALSFFGGLMWSLTIVGFFLGGETLLFATAPWQFFQWRRELKKVKKQKAKLSRLYAQIEELETQTLKQKKAERQQAIRETLFRRRKAVT